MTGVKSNLLPAAQSQHWTAFSGVFVLSFAVFLIVACVAQVLFLPWRSWFPGAEGSNSLLASVRSTVYTFMSYLN